MGGAEMGAKYIMRGGTARTVLASLTLAIAPGLKADNEPGHPLVIEPAIARTIAPAAVRKVGNLTATASNVSISYNAMPGSPAPQNTDLRGHRTASVKFWYGEPEQLKVIAKQGNTINAILTYEIAMQEPWANEQQLRCLDLLWYKESKFDELQNGGIPQAKPPSKMASEGKDWPTNPVPQIKYGIKYIDMTKKKGGQGYLVPCNALNHSTTRNWYSAKELNPLSSPGQPVPLPENW